MIPIAAKTTLEPSLPAPDMNAEHLNDLIAQKHSVETLLSGIDVKLLVFGILVLIGIAGETWYGIETWRNNRRLRSVQVQIDEEQEKLSRAETEETKAELTKANNMAAAAKQELEQIKEKQRPRRLSSEQANKLSMAMAALSGERLVIDAIAGDAEAVDFANQIKQVLEGSGIKVSEVTQRVCSIRGVAILLNAEPPPFSFSFRLQQALAEIGITAPGGLVPNEPANTVTLVIGTKP